MSQQIKLKTINSNKNNQLITINEIAEIKFCSLILIPKKEEKNSNWTI